MGWAGVEGWVGFPSHKNGPPIFLGLLLKKKMQLNNWKRKRNGQNWMEEVAAMITFINDDIDWNWGLIWLEFNGHSFKYGLEYSES